MILFFSYDIMHIFLCQHIPLLPLSNGYLQILICLPEQWSPPNSTPIISLNSSSLLRTTIYSLFCTSSIAKKTLLDFLLFECTCGLFPPHSFFLLLQDSGISPWRGEMWVVCPCGWESLMMWLLSSVVSDFTRMPYLLPHVNLKCSLVGGVGGLAICLKITFGANLWSLCSFALSSFLIRPVYFP